MIRIAVCDDVKQDMENITKYIRIAEVKLRIKEKIEIAYYFSGEDIVAAVKEEPEKYHIIIMDVQLGGITGKRAAREIRKLNSDVIICIMTRNDMPVPADFRLNAYRYIMKDDSQEAIIRDMKSTLEECCRLNSRKHIFLQTAQGSIRVNIRDIMYISKLKRGSQVHLRDDSIISVKECVPELQEKLGDMGFAMAHNSYMVNYSAVTAFIDHGKVVRVENGEELNVSKKYKDSFMRGHFKINCRD